MDANRPKEERNVIITSNILKFKCSDLWAGTECLSQCDYVTGLFSDISNKALEIWVFLSVDTSKFNELWFTI